MSEKVPKAPIEHRDKLGRLLKVGDCVAYPDSNSLSVGIVKKLNPKLVGIGYLGKKVLGEVIQISTLMILYYSMGQK